MFKEQREEWKGGGEEKGTDWSAVWDEEVAQDQHQPRRHGLWCRSRSIDVVLTMVLELAYAA